MTEINGFSDPTLLILTSLASGDKHGYAMMEDIETVTGIRLGPGTLYGALARLEQRGWIEALPSEERRRPYRMTRAGEIVLREQLVHLEKFTTLGRERLGLSLG